MTKVVILVLQETNTLSLAAAVDPMRAANRQAGKPVFDWHFATPDTQDVTLTSGLTIPAAPVNRIDSCDVLIVVAGFDLKRQSTPQLMASLRRLAKPNTLLAAMDGGPWVVAKAGLLNGKQATTHWEDIESFAISFPDVDTVNARYVANGAVWTSGGAAPALDMMLHLIEARHGTHLAAKVAAGFIHTNQPAPTDPQLRHLRSMSISPLVKRAHLVMEQNLETPLTIPDIAARLRLSPRTLQNHFKQTLGTTAKAYYLSLRLAEAHSLLTQTSASLQHIAVATGFGAQSSFSRAYSAHHGRSPKAARGGSHVHLAP
ncbi:GlxA family transcriptional regulator [Tateyamaria pelophila]|uniref:GlxA family transcriptional regulator n=1 Tax=Tateyamaria pelophila TaxID=328415 RepID=UPI001CBC7A6F|nr:GlxA family transcriptional regulator [Tateyamaria pelophila]